MTDPRTSLSGVLDVKVDDFSSIIPRHAVWLVEFYLPWCPHCQHLAPTIRELGFLVASGALSNIKIAKVDTTGGRDTRHLREKYEIRAFPHVVMIFPNQSFVEMDIRERSFSDFLRFIHLHHPDDGAAKAARDAYSSVQEKVAQQSSTANALVTTSVARTGRIVELMSHKQFDQVVFDHRVSALVLFCSRSDGFCQGISELWEELAESQHIRAKQHNVTVARVNREDVPKVFAVNKVKGVPTICFFTRWDKSGTLRYHGVRTLPDIERWIMHYTGR